MVEPRKEIKYNFTDASKAFSPDYFLGQFAQMQKFGSINPQTKAGLDAYLKVDPNATSYDMQALKETKELIEQEESNRLAQFTAKNFGGLVALLDGESSIGIAVQTRGFKKKGKPVGTPEEEKARKDKEDKYNGVVSSINNFQDISRLIKENPQEYVHQTLKKIMENGANRAFASFYANMAQHWMKGDQRQAQRRAVTSLQAYGAQKYLAENFGQAQKVAVPTDEQTKAQEALGKLQSETELESDKDKKLAKMEKLEKGFKEFQDKFGEQMIAEKTIPQIVGAVQESAYESIAQKKADDEKKKKAAEAKK
jgi:hypothetical protein